MRRSQLNELSSPEAFFWATGIEDTFITAPHPKTGRTLDEYQLTDHYERWSEDLGLMRDLGVRIARYGIPWHRINPAPGKWEWAWTDKALERILELGIDPIVDLVHYGLPSWIEGAYQNPKFPNYMAEYAARVAERFRGRIHMYTPLNEPRVTAWYCGKLGWWPPYERGWGGFVSVMIGVCRGIVESIQAMKEVDPEIIPVHVDATDLYESPDYELESEVAQRQEMVFLALDLVSGRIVSGHPLFNWLRKQGASDQSMVWFQQHQVPLDLIGINMYPMFSRKVLRPSSHGLRTQMPYASAEIVSKLSRMYYERYQTPIFISETASVGTLKRREAWLGDSVAAVRQVRAEGVPLVGYTWWPMFALVTWAYRQGTHPPDYYLKQMGLWDLDAAQSAKLARVPTRLIEQYQRLAAGGSQAVGSVENVEEQRRQDAA
ncbi:MAG: glycoside hydrolase family 1 [Verrucomicrobiales bacterium]|nr:glycoside hydrolase family 1 [Verrucomicrobiales bacterium]